ncbi:glucose-1-phosphate thymidylyltransferase [Candidatus Uhrbacteria bacterium]|nr:glucose-1-phosphate thymidylyltransferase [Candidatus Uhrbacteria bacterium]
MKALITAGGRATRLRPITYTWNKHLIPLAGKPMLFYALEKIAETGIRDVGIIVNPGESILQNIVGNGGRWGMRITYIEQTGGPLGIAHAVKIAQPFLGNEPFIFYLGDNIILGSVKKFVERFEREGLNCLLALSRVKDPQRFGVPEIKDGRIIRVEEKPQNPKSNFAVSGIYLYDKIFFDAFDKIAPSSRGEYEISDIHSELIRAGAKVGFEEITGWWKDTGKPEDLLHGNQLILEELGRGAMLNLGETHPDAVIQGKVSVGKGTVIGPDVLIRGPVIIGENCKIEKSYIGPYTSIGGNCAIAGGEIEHSILFDGVSINCNARIVDSLIGAGATVVSSSSSLPLGHKMIAGDNCYIEI